MLLSEFHLSPRVSDGLAEVLNRTSGLILICGPAGAGKRTTAEACASEVGRRRPGLKVQRWDSSPEVSEQDLTLTEILGDPSSAISVCELAARSLVLAILRSGRSAGALDRLTDLGVSDEALLAARPAVVTQQLCRRLCTSCRVARPTFTPPGIDLPPTGGVVHEPQGCDLCSSGYLGHVPLLEILLSTPTWQPRKTDGLEHLATMRQDGIAKLACGLTSLAELLRVAAL
jgi:type II secretory ATPase GspE/PulE/Tfp pilus assembly ATPase PilB-like protein